MEDDCGCWENWLLTLSSSPQDPSLIEKYSDDEEEENVADEPKSNSGVALPW